MATSNNKVKFNLKNVHYAKLTTGGDGTTTFATPVAIPGAVSLKLSASGEPEPFYADGITYYTINNNGGYSGDLEIALIPEAFRTDILGETLDADKVLVEDADAELGAFALLFEFDGDVKHIRHVLYNCAASRAAIEGQTNEDKKTVQTETLTVTASPLVVSGKSIVKGKTGDNTTDSVYTGWYSAVHLPATTPAT